MSRKSVMVILLLPVVSLMFLAHCRAEDAPTTQPMTDQQQLENRWADLKQEEPQSTRAVLGFGSRPDQTVAFFKDCLVPLSLSEDDLNKLISDLGSDDDAVLKAAEEKLNYFDPRIVKDLPTLIKDIDDTIAKNRLIALLDNQPIDSLQGKTIQVETNGAGQISFVIRTARSTESWTINSPNSKKSWLRATRAILILEHIGTPDAIAILKNMAGGYADAQPTKVAQEALDQLGANK